MCLSINTSFGAKYIDYCYCCYSKIHVLNSSSNNYNIAILLWIVGKLNIGVLKLNYQQKKGNRILAKEKPWSWVSSQCFSAKDLVVCNYSSSSTIYSI